MVRSDVVARSLGFIKFIGETVLDGLFTRLKTFQFLTRGRRVSPKTGDYNAFLPDSPSLVTDPDIPVVPFADTVEAPADIPVEDTFAVRIPAAVAEASAAAHIAAEHPEDSETAADILRPAEPAEADSIALKAEDIGVPVAVAVAVAADLHCPNNTD